MCWLPVGRYMFNDTADDTVLVIELVPNSDERQ